MALRLIFVDATDILYRKVGNQIPNYPRNIREERRTQLYRSGRLQACKVPEYFRLHVNCECKTQIYRQLSRDILTAAIKLPCSRARQPKENQIPTAGAKTGRGDKTETLERRTPNAACPRRQWSFGIRLQRDICRCWIQLWSSLSYDAVSTDRCRRSQGQKPGCEPQKSP